MRRTMWKNISFLAAVILLFVGFSGNSYAKSLYLLNMGSGLGEGLYAYDIQNDELEYQTHSTITNEGNAVGVALDEDSQYLFITCESANYIQIYNANTMASQPQVTAPGAIILASRCCEVSKQVLNLFRIYFISKEEPYENSRSCF